LGKPTPPLLRGLNFPVMFLDQAVDRGQVGLLRRAVEPGVDLNSLEEERFQDRIAFPLISIHERPFPLFHSSLASLRETASEENALTVSTLALPVRELEHPYPPLGTR
jgi:hypothetical protein